MATAENHGVAARRPGDGNPRHFVPTAVLFVALLAIAAGSFFRYYHLDGKVFSGDEVDTSIRLLGETEADLVRHADRFHTARDLRLVLHPSPPEGASNPLAPALSLAAEDPVHPPIYYLLGHLWLAMFGNTIAAERACSATLSLLAMPLAFFLAAELYGSRRAGWIGAALFALAPIDVLYAQVSREYAFWAVVLLALGLAVLRAARRDRAPDWAIVAVASAAAAYVNVLSLFAIVGLAAYVAIVGRANRGLLLRAALAFGAGVAAFVPWALAIARHTETVRQGMGPIFATHLTPREVARALIRLVRLNVYDANLEHSRFNTVMTGLALVALLAATAYVVRRGPARISLFVLLPIACSALPLVAASLVAGASVKEARYFMPMFVFLDLCLAAPLSDLIGSAKPRAVAAGYVLLVLLLGVRAGSCAASARAATWWNTSDNTVGIAIAVDRSRRPLLVSDEILYYPLQLADYLRPDVPVLLRPRCYECDDRSTPTLDASSLPDASAYSDVYALGPSPHVRELLQDDLARRHADTAYHCINVRDNCASDLNFEPVPAAPH